MNVGPPPAARALDGLPRCLVHREHVASVDAHARHPVAGCLVDERLGVRLRGQRRRDRPLVVVAEEDQRRLHHRRRSSHPRGTRPRSSRRRRSRRSRTRSRPSASCPTRARRRAARASRSGRRSRRRCSRRGSTSRRDGRATSAGRSRAACRAAARSRTRGSSGRSSRRPRARARSRPASPRGSRTSRTCRCGPGGDTRASARRTSAAAPSSGRCRSGSSRPTPSSSRSSSMTRRSSCSPCATWAIGANVLSILDQHGDGAALRVEHGPLDVAEILAVRVQRHRPVALDLHPVEVVAVQVSRRFAPRPARIESAVGTSVRRRTRTGATTSRPSSNCASGASGSGSRFAYVYGLPFATSANAARPKPFTSSTGSMCPRYAASERMTASANARSPGRLPSSVRPMRSTRRTASASSPTPAPNANRRPFTRPTVILRVLCSEIASASRRAAATGSAGSPSARESTLVPPPGRKPIGTPSPSPFSASLKPPSPEKTTTASHPASHAAVTISVA